MENIKQDKLQDKFMEFWDSKKEILGLGNYSDAITGFWLNELDIAIAERDKEVVGLLKVEIEKLDTYCRHRNTLYPEGNERFEMDDMVLLPDVLQLLDQEK